MDNSDRDIDDRFDGSVASVTPPVPRADQVEDHLVAERLAAGCERSCPPCGRAAPSGGAARGHCSEYLAQLRATIDTLGRVEPDDLPEEDLDEFVALHRRRQGE